MGNPKICDCNGKLNFHVDEVVFKADICPDCKLPGSNVLLDLDNLKFKSTEANLPDYYSSSKGKGISISGTGILEIAEENTRAAVMNTAYYSLFLFDSDVGRENLASITFFNINNRGAILAYSITFFSREVKLSISPLNRYYSSAPLEEFSLPDSQDNGRGRIIIVKNGDIEVREL